MSEATPFERVLGAAFGNLPAPVRELHALRHSALTSGRAEITSEPGAMKWLFCKFAGLPKPGLDVSVSVQFIPVPRGSERWERRFGIDATPAAWKPDQGGRQAASSSISGCSTCSSGLSPATEASAGRLPVGGGWASRCRPCRSPVSIAWKAVMATASASISMSLFLSSGPFCATRAGSNALGPETA